MSETDWKVTHRSYPDGSPYSFTATDGPFCMDVKHDGCVDIYRSRDTTPDHLHLCSAAELDAMIKRLTKLRALAVERFGTEWAEDT